MEQDVSNHADVRAGAPRLLLLRGARLPSSRPRSSLPSAGFLISLSDFEMLIWMSGSSLR